MLTTRVFEDVSFVIYIKLLTSGCVYNQMMSCTSNIVMLERMANKQEK